MRNNVNTNNKIITVDDFRGISISPVISKVFEHYVLERYCSLCIILKTDGYCSVCVFAYVRLIPEY